MTEVDRFRYPVGRGRRRDSGAQARACRGRRGRAGRRRNLLAACLVPVVQVVIVRPVAVIKVVVKHDHTRTAGRHVMYVPLGAAVVVKRLWDSRSSSRYERFIRAAELAWNLRGGIGVGDTAGSVPQGPPPAPGRHDRAAPQSTAGGPEDSARHVRRPRRARGVPSHRREAHRAQSRRRSRSSPAS